MHSKIFQISLEPISADNYVCPDDFYDNSQDFADYIGDDVKGDDRLAVIKALARDLSDIFDYDPSDSDVLIYKGMDVFLKDWRDKIQETAERLTAANLLKDLNLYQLSGLTKKTHKDVESRFYIEDWNGYAGPASDLINFLAGQEKGARIYVGAIIDYHF